jgi:ubiquinone/menaquinone biosynthesis C-methylase UbiE
MDLEGVKNCWDELARTRPVGAMLPAGMSAIKDVDALFAFGRREIDDVMRYVESRGINIGRRKALDFGCGLGRSTQALAGYFDEIYGLDISPSIIELAEKYNRHQSQCKYLVNQTNDLKILADNSFDFIWCYGVFHLVEPQYFRNYIKEFFRVLVPGGLVVFHQASKPAGTLKGLIMRAMPARLLNSYRRKKYGFEVYGMQREQVIELIHQAGATLLDTREDRRTPGRNWMAFQYYVRG